MNLFNLVHSLDRSLPLLNSWPCIYHHCCVFIILYHSSLLHKSMLNSIWIAVQLYSPHKCAFQTRLLRGFEALTWSHRPLRRCFTSGVSIHLAMSALLPGNNKPEQFGSAWSVFSSQILIVLQDSSSQGTPPRWASAWSSKTIQLHPNLHESRNIQF